VFLTASPSSVPPASKSCGSAGRRCIGLPGRFCPQYFLTRTGVT
jgi:hypothetical protein